MRRFILFVLILLAIGGIVLYWNTTTQKGKEIPWNPFSWIISSSSTAPFTRSVQETISGAGASVSEGAKSALSAAQEKIEESSKAVQDAVSGGIGGFVDNLKESAKKKVAEALGLTPEETLELLAADQLANLSICTTVKNPNITYVFENPFSPPQDFSFEVNWGDGSTSQGSLRAHNEKTSSAHHYESSGIYINVFKIVSNSQTIIIRRKICLE